MSATCRLPPERYGEFFSSSLRREARNSPISPTSLPSGVLPSFSTTERVNGSLVLLKDYLTKERLDEAWWEIERYKKIAEGLGETVNLCLVIDSVGGETEATLKFTERVLASTSLLYAKVYRAESAAALIAMRMHEREIVRDGVFTVNLGSVEIDSGSLITEEKVPKHIIEQAKKWREAVFSVLGKGNFSQQGYLMEKLIAKNNLTLTADECLELKLVHRII